MTEIITEEERRRNYFILQWHLTARCEYNCMHCYMHDSPTYKNELDNELGFETCINVIDDFHEALVHWDVPGRINFTGGDPLLKDEIFDIIQYAKNKGIHIGILGNPDKITYENAKRLKKSGVYRYQISIDGMEKMHDTLRGKKGAFNDAIRAIHVLEDEGIQSVVMFTLSRTNAHELIDIIRLASREGVSIFDFARLVPIGSGDQFKEQMLSPQEYRSLLLKVLGEYKRLQEDGIKTHFGRKENLWVLLYKELGLFKPFTTDKVTIFRGCAIGCSTLAVLADGTVLACRRLPIEIGKAPENHIKDIFIYSEELNRMRQVETMKKCRGCELLQYCRGCPAVAYGLYNDYLADDPQCWKVI